MLLRIFILIVASIIVYKFLHRYNGVSPETHSKISLTNKMTKKEESFLSKRNRVASTVERLHENIQKLGIFKLNKRLEDELKYYSLRLNIQLYGMTCGFEFFYVLKSLTALTYIALILFACLFELNYLILIVLYPLAFKFPDIIFNGIIKEKDLEIDKEFDRFYSKFYYRLKVKQNYGTKLSSIAKSYMTVAGPEMQALCKNFIADCTNSEAVALVNLRQNYRTGNMQRFSILIHNTITGTSDSIRPLEIFKEELDLGTSRYLEEQRVKKIELGDRIVYLCYGILLEIILLYAVAYL